MHNNDVHNIYFVLKDLKGIPGSRGLPGKRVSALQAELVLSTSLFLPPSLTRVGHASFRAWWESQEKPAKLAKLALM